MDRTTEVRSRIGMDWEAVQQLDWDGWFPHYGYRGGRIVVIDVIPADATERDLSRVVAVSIIEGKLVEVCADGWQDGFAYGMECDRLGIDGRCVVEMPARGTESNNA